MGVILATNHTICSCLTCAAAKSQPKHGIGRLSAYTSTAHANLLCHIRAFIQFQCQWNRSNQCCAQLNHGRAAEWKENLIECNECRRSLLVSSFLLFLVMMSNLPSKSEIASFMFASARNVFTMASVDRKQTAWRIHPEPKKKKIKNSFGEKSFVSFSLVIGGSIGRFKTVKIASRCRRWPQRKASEKACGHCKLPLIKA